MSTIEGIVETQLCKLRGTSDTFVGRAYSIFHLQYGACELKLRYGCLYSVSHFLRKVVRACSMFYPYEGCRSVTPQDAARVNRTIFHNHSVH